MHFQKWILHITSYMKYTYGRSFALLNNNFSFQEMKKRNNNSKSVLCIAIRHVKYLIHIFSYDPPITLCYITIILQLRKPKIISILLNITTSVRSEIGMSRVNLISESMIFICLGFSTNWGEIYEWGWDLFIIKKAIIYFCIRLDTYYFQGLSN